MALLVTAGLDKALSDLADRFTPILQNLTALEERLRKLESQGPSLATVEYVDIQKAGLEKTVAALERTMQRKEKDAQAMKDDLKKVEAEGWELKTSINVLSKQMEHQEIQIRETQERLADKASLSEVAVVEAQMQKFAPKEEIARVERRLQDYALLSSTTLLAESVKSAVDSLALFWKGPKIENALREMQGWMENCLAGYAKKADTSQALQSLKVLIEDGETKRECQIETVTSNITDLSDRVTSIYVELNEDIRRRATKEDFDSLRAAQKHSCKTADLESFKEEALPLLTFCVSSIEEFSEKIKVQDMAVQRIDELLLDKASKYDLIVTNAKIVTCFQKEAAQQEMGRLQASLAELEKKVEFFVKAEDERLSQSVPTDSKEELKEIQSLLQLKSDRSEIVDMYAYKANRADAEILGHSQDVMKRQLEYIAVTTMELAKLALGDPKSGEPAAVRVQQKQKVLAQAQAVWNWVIDSSSCDSLPILERTTKEFSSSMPTTISETMKNSTGKPRGRPVESVVGSVGARTARIFREKKENEDKRRAVFEQRLGVHPAGDPPSPRARDARACTRTPPKRRSSPVADPHAHPSP